MFQRTLEFHQQENCEQHVYICSPSNQLQLWLLRMGDPVGSEDVQRLQELVEKLHSQVSSLKAGKENQWRGAEELWELRRENEQLRRFRDEHADSASAHQPRAAKCDSTEEADGRQVFAIAEGVATGSTFA